MRSPLELISLLAQSAPAQTDPGSIPGLAWGFMVMGFVVGGVGVVVVIRLLGNQLVNRATSEAERILRHAEEDAATKRKEVELEAKNFALAERERLEEELKARRDEQRETEKRISKREDQIERQSAKLAEREERLDTKTADVEQREASNKQKSDELDKLIDRQKSELQAITGLSKDEAERKLLSIIEDDVRDESARLTRTLLEQAETKAVEEAREITITAMQRYASEFVAESTTRSVAIPSDDVKGRIIGREGRNIRAIEKATGADIIVDDTPGVIVVSCFDKVRQAIAVNALEKLVSDGRIHPTRVEEVVEKCRAEIEEKVEKAGKDAVLEAKLRNVSPKIVEAMGKLSFRTSYGQNVLKHSLEVAYISQIIAEMLGMDGRVARRCGFLHDIGKAMDHEMEGGHPHIGAVFAKQHGESEPVLNVIAGHHGDVPATSFYTPIIMTADALSGARPGARRESYERYVQRLEQLQGIALEHRGVEEAHAIQAGREVRVMVNAQRVNDDEAYLIAKQIASKVADEMTFPGEIKVTVLRETRAVEIAR
ncbi:MAG: ribonuclease Y [Planctomycetota bacterium]